MEFPTPTFGSTRERRSRSFAKAVSWRITGTLDTFILSWIITGNVVIAGTISAVEVITKIVLFYIHERIWARVPWGRDHQKSRSDD